MEYFPIFYRLYTKNIYVMAQKLLEMYSRCTPYLAHSDTVRIGREKLKISDEIDRLARKKGEIDRELFHAIDMLNSINRWPDGYLFFEERVRLWQEI